MESCKPVLGDNMEVITGIIKFGPASVLLVESGEAEKDEILREKVSLLCMPVLMVYKNKPVGQEGFPPSPVWEVNMAYKNNCDHHGKKTTSAMGVSPQGSGNCCYPTPTGPRNDQSAQQEPRTDSTPLAYWDTYHPSMDSTPHDMDPVSQRMASGY